MKIRKMVSGDISRCASIMARNHLWAKYHVTLESAQSRFSSGLENNPTILIADSDEGITGFVWYVNKGAFNRSGYIMLIGVDPDMQSHGVGFALMQAAEQEIEKVSSDVILLVSDFNVDAQRFYQKLGYQQIGKIDNYVIAGVNELIFRKILHE